MAAEASAARQTVTVFAADGSGTASTESLPEVFLSPIRSDVVNLVHSGLAKNRRQPYAVSRMAGMQTAAESWGTGRAVSRIPRVPGGGTHRSGQGAFGNMCRGGRMFAPTKIWRKWHVKVAKTQRRHAVAAALAASALPALVMARGHRVDNVPEVPLVVDSAVQELKKTRAAVDMLRAVGALDDVERVKLSRHIRAGRGKMRNRRYVQRRGPLVVYKHDHGIVKAVRNLPGVDTCRVDRLNLLQLAPGGHLGRFVVWTLDALKELHELYGHGGAPSARKSGYVLPRAVIGNADVSRLISSDEVQSALRPTRAHLKGRLMPRKRNALRNRALLRKLNPAVDDVHKRLHEPGSDAAERRRDTAKQRRQFRPSGRAYYQRMTALE